MEALGNVLPLAIAVAIFPVPIIAAVLILASHRGRAKGLVFTLAWCTGLLSVGAIVLLLAGGADASDAGEPATWVSVLLLALGVTLVGLAIKQWRGRPAAGAEAPMPKWMRAIGGFTIWRAGAAGFALSALNPKNVLLTVAAAAEIGEVGSAAGQQAAVLLVYVVVASLGVLAPLALALALGERSRRPLDQLQRWMARHNSKIMTVLMLLIGAKLIWDALSA